MDEYLAGGLGAAMLVKGLGHLVIVLLRRRCFRWAITALPLLLASLSLLRTLKGP